MERDRLSDKVQLAGAILFIAMSPILWIVVAYFGVYKNDFDHVAVITVAVAYFAVFPVATILSTMLRIGADFLDRLHDSQSTVRTTPIRPILR